MRDLLSFGFKEFDRMAGNVEEERFELRCIPGFALVAWFRAVKLLDGRYESDCSSCLLIRQPELSHDRQQIALRWLVEKSELYLNCNRVQVMTVG